MQVRTAMKRKKTVLSSGAFGTVAALLEHPAKGIAVVSLDLDQALPLCAPGAEPGLELFQQSIPLTGQGLQPAYDSDGLPSPSLPLEADRDLLPLRGGRGCRNGRRRTLPAGHCLLGGIHPPRLLSGHIFRLAHFSAI